MNSKQVLWNALTTTGQELASAAILFFLYRFLFRTIGAAGLGVWALVLASTSVITLANQGFSSSVVKFVAKYAARGKVEDVSILIQTAFLSVSATLAVVCVALYPAATWILRLLLPAASVGAALAIIPWALLSLWINASGDVFLAGLAGHELITYRNYIVLGSSAFYLLLAYFLVPRFGLLGLAYAQVVEAVVAFVAMWILLRRQLPSLPMVPNRWSYARFREMLEYGAELQFITVCQAVREPVTKALLAKFAGLAATGFYDMASRWVVSFRELIVQANQVLVPTIANLQERDPESLPRIYRDSYRVILYLAVPTFAFLLLVSPIVSFVWLGSYQPVFVCFVALLALGWLVNVLSNPAYVVNLGTGALRWVSIGCAATAVLTVVLGVTFAKTLGGTGVVLASVISLALGYVLVVISFHLENRMPFRVLLPRESSSLIVSGVFSVGSFFFFFRNPHISPFSIRATSGLLATILFLIAIPAWSHPLRRRLLRWVSSRLPA